MTQTATFLDAKTVYGHVKKCAQRVEQCASLIEHCLANSPERHAWEYINTIISSDCPGLIGYHLKNAVQDYRVEEEPRTRGFSETPVWKASEGNPDRYNLGLQIYETNPVNRERQQAQMMKHATSIHEDAKEYLKLYELMALVESDPEDGKNGVVHAIQQWSREGRETKVSASKREYFTDLPRVTWKGGFDFRTAALYWFVWLDGVEMCHFWPKPGARQFWI